MTKTRHLYFDNAQQLNALMDYGLTSTQVEQFRRSLQRGGTAQFTDGLGRVTKVKITPPSKQSSTLTKDKLRQDRKIPIRLHAKKQDQSRKNKNG